MATEVKLKLALEGARVVSQEIDGVTHSVGNMRSASISANTSLAELGSQAIALTKTMAGLSAIQKGVTAAGDYAGLASRMKLLTGSAEAAAIAMQSVQDIAMRQGASLAAVGDSYAKIGQAMLTMGGTSADTARMVETVAAALRLGNASTQEAASAMRQFGQAMAKGKLNGDEFVSLMENAPYLMDAVAASLGKTKGDLFAMAEAGKLTSQVFGDAVLGSFDSVTGKVATLAPTIGQAMERITTSFTVAAAASSNVGMVSSAAFAAMGFAADHAAQILGMLTTGAIVGLTNQVMRATSAVAAKVTATLADRAAMVASLQATVASTEARAIYTGIVLREAQATLASTAGMAASVRAQTAVVAATAAHTAATVAQTEAQLALNTATSLGARALGLLGGPIGAITAVLGLGLTAWSLWGSSAKDAEDKASAAVERSTASIIADLDNQIQRLERRNALANAKIGGNGFDTASPAADRMGALQIEIDNLRGATTEADLVKRNRLLAEQGQLQLKLNELEQKAAPERAAKALQDHTAAMAKYAPQVDKVTAAIEAERKALGAAFTPEDEAKIKAYFAAHKTGAASVSEAQKQVNAGEKAYGDIMAKDTGYAENFTETVLALVAARDKNNWASEKYNEVIAAYLAMQPGAVAAAKEQAAADAEVAKWQAEAAKSYDEAVASATKNTTSVQEQLEKQLDHNAAIGLGVTAIANLEAAKLSDQATSKERLAALADEIDWSGRLGAQYRQEAIALRELSAAKIAGAQKQAGYDAAQDMAKEQKKAAEESSKYWEDALMRAFESGKSGWQSLWSTIKNTLQTQVLKIFLAPVVGGVSGMANAATGSGGASPFAAYGNPFTNFSGSMGNSIADFGTSMVDKGFTSLGTGIENLGLSLNANAPMVNAFGDALGYATALMAASEGKWGQAAGAAIGTYFGGPIGSAIGSAIGGMVDELFGGGGGPKTESGYGYSIGGPGNVDRLVGGATGSAAVYAKGIEDGWAALASKFGLASSLSVGAFTSTDPEGDALTQVQVAAGLDGQSVYSRADRLGGTANIGNVGRTPEELAAALQEESVRVLFSALKASNLDGEYTAYFASIGDSVAEMTAALDTVVLIKDFRTAMDSMPFAYLRDMSFRHRCRA
jgi:tape measure domain-containing protein